VRVAEPTPRPGDFFITLDDEGHPRFIWRTTAVTSEPLVQVDETFAWDEGEGDRTRDWWLDAHRRYFTGKRASARQAYLDGELSGSSWTASRHSA
jgi:uncharacterized protein YhfF